VLEFRLLGFDVEIHPTFLILGLFVLDAGLGGLGILLWMAAALASVLTHELGHAIAVRRAGGLVHRVMLYGLGGVTLWRESPGRPIGWGKRIGIAAAGAGLGFLVAGALFGAVKAGIFGRFASLLIVSPFDVFLGDAVVLSKWGTFFLGAFIWTTFVWGLVNWLPIGGLDGWHILAELLERWIPGRGRFHAAVIGLLVAIGVGLLLFRAGYQFAPLLLLFFAVQQFAQVRTRR
jgi:Zn-dependent protease